MIPVNTMALMLIISINLFLILCFIYNLREVSHLFEQAEACSWCELPLNVPAAQKNIKQRLKEKRASLKTLRKLLMLSFGYSVIVVVMLYLA
ncbi:MAG TPA: hypothetical protein DCM44_04205 [Pantoea sp.]|uniref:hypothetical protein n=1 Tax=Pantoea TaxID=53335 RepID=UPI000BB554C8|nr:MULTISPECIES: hypothetical protein [Pantoea]PNK63854.1 hypothetical protein A6J33_014260 [Pantoea sp. FDAARGOS_194]HAK34060.1 hypothetical protein [Pantoea sp.]